MVKMKISKNIELLLPGFPGTANRGFCGWSSIILIKEPYPILYDTGFYTDRAILLDKLTEVGLAAADIKTVVLSHLHYDHCLNASLFPKAEFMVATSEVEYALAQQGPERQDINIIDNVQHFLTTTNVREVSEGDFIAEGIEFLHTPGHTPGGLALQCQSEAGTIILAGDAIKHGREAVLGEASMVFASAKEAQDSIKKLLSIGDIIIPGHDRPFIYDQEKGLVYLGGFDIEFTVKVNPLKSPRQFTISLPQNYD